MYHSSHMRLQFLLAARLFPYGIGSTLTPYASSSPQVVYETLPGWQADISAARQWAQLPAAAQAYVQRIEDLIGEGSSEGVQRGRGGVRREGLGCFERKGEQGSCPCKTDGGG